MGVDFASFLDEVREACQPIIAERSRLRGLPQDCYWKEGSHIVPFWRGYWSRLENRGSHYDLPVFAVIDHEFDLSEEDLLDDSEIPDFLKGEFYANAGNDSLEEALCGEAPCGGV